MLRQRRHPFRRLRRPRQRRSRPAGAGDPGPRPGVRGLGLLHGDQPWGARVSPGSGHGGVRGTARFTGGGEGTIHGGRADGPGTFGTGFYSADGSARRRRHYLKMFVHPELHCPAKPENLRDIAGELAARTRDLMLQLGVAISESLGVAGGRVSEALDLGSCFQMLVQNQYPACAGADDVGSIAPWGSPVTPTTASSRSSYRTA
ncbi:hypothetical protein PAHAL_8G218000 [Panicum hallii]|uniref:Uncharacterized protein n=1 Tax=Panicum hallii TaxID=206008 RepID=A0A2T8I9S6_9POAL|nr:hypothetical protein PAHAL_8G218000 [Panicum hallii]